jgi:outer membrane protein OmpA-like peptidoglycan-associated protein
LRAAIEQDADNWRALAALGVANDLERRYAEARQAYVSALNSCPNSAAILNNLALSESYTGNFVSSMSRLNRAMQVQPGSLRIRRNWVVLSTLKARCADCDGDEYAQLARSIHPQDWRNANSEITCGNYVTRADLIATELQENDFIDMRVHFEFDSDTLTPEAHEALDELAEAINSNALADYRFRLEGHTDALGSDEYNQDLSDRRAASVSNYLTNVHGIDTGRLESIGFGESQLAAQDDPTSGLNRRVRVVKLGRITDFPIAGL